VLQDLPPAYRPNRAATIGGLGPKTVASLQAILRTGHFHSYATLLGWLSPGFVDTVLGRNQAPPGEWQPEMAQQGLIPNINDVVRVLDESVSQKYLDL
jgi:hypothetical protein